MWRLVVISNHICVHVTSRDAHVCCTMSPLCRIFSTFVTCVRDLHLRWRFYKSWLTTKSENLVGKATWEAAFQIVVLHRLIIKDFFMAQWVVVFVWSCIRAKHSLTFAKRVIVMHWLTRPNQMPLSIWLYRKSLLEKWMFDYLSAAAWSHKSSEKLNYNATKQV